MPDQLKADLILLAHELGHGNAMFELGATTCLIRPDGTDHAQIIPIGSEHPNLANDPAVVWFGATAGLGALMMLIKGGEKVSKMLTPEAVEGFCFKLADQAMISDTDLAVMRKSPPEKQSLMSGFKFGADIVRITTSERVRDFGEVLDKRLLILLDRRWLFKSLSMDSLQPFTIAKMTTGGYAVPC